MNTLEILKAARQLISNPDNWCIQEMQSGSAFCALGAMTYVATGDVHNILVCHSGDAAKAFAVLQKHADGSIAEYNNTHTHAEVLALFDKAIESLEPVIDFQKLAEELSKTPLLEYKMNEAQSNLEEFVRSA